MIESVSCSTEIIPDELDVENNCTTALDWVKLQRTDPNLSVIIKLIESDQLFKRKLHHKDSSEVKALLRIRVSNCLNTYHTGRAIQTTVLLKKFFGN